jgi:hypothetical protein
MRLALLRSMCFSSFIFLHYRIFTSLGTTFIGRAAPCGHVPSGDKGGFTWRLLIGGDLKVDLFSDLL